MFCQQSVLWLTTVLQSSLTQTIRLHQSSHYTKTFVIFITFLLMYSTPPCKIIWQITYCICTCNINYNYLNARVITYRRWSKLICHILFVVFCFKLVKSIFCTLWTVFAVIWTSVVFGFGAVYLITFCFLQCFPHLESERKIGCFEAGNCRSLPPVTSAHSSEFNNIIIIFLLQQGKWSSHTQKCHILRYTSWKSWPRNHCYCWSTTG